MKRGALARESSGKSDDEVEVRGQAYADSPKAGVSASTFAYVSF